MIYRQKASKDNFVTNALITGRRVTGSNAGASEILEMFKMSGVPQSGTQANILIAFQTSSAIAAYSASNSTGSITWKLVLRNVETQNSNIGSFDAEVGLIERDWDEGAGHDIDYWTDKGYSNWKYAKNGILWTNAGARPTSLTGSKTFHFENGHEDLSVDVTSIVQNAVYGFFVGVSSSQLIDSNEYYLKAFRSRQTHFPEYQPYLEASWNDSTGSWTNPWTDLIDHTGSLVMNLYDVRGYYDNTESPIIHAHIQPRDWNPATVSVANSDASGTILTSAYYRVINDVSDEVVVPFGTGSDSNTKLSYNSVENYFKFYMSNLVPGMVCRFDIGYYDAAGSWKVIHGDEKFRVGGY
jgi:hypothetical protein